MDVPGGGSPLRATFVYVEVSPFGVTIVQWEALSIYKSRYLLGNCPSHFSGLYSNLGHSGAAAASQINGSHNRDRSIALVDQDTKPSTVCKTFSTQI